jgi:hypothetical protein
MYADDGQRIVAEVREEEILFSDLARHINGSIPLGKYLQRSNGIDMDKYTIETLVMTNYDFGNYSGSGTTLKWETNK